jgi:hypothetical protein
LQAPVANSFDRNFFRGYATPLFYVSRQLNAIETGPRKIFYLHASGTVHMVVWGWVPAKPGSISIDKYLCHQAMAFEGRKCSIGRVQGDRRDTSLHPFMDCFCRGMISRVVQLTKYLQTLMRYLETFLLAYLLQNQKLILKRPVCSWFIGCH